MSMRSAGSLPPWRASGEYPLAQDFVQELQQGVPGPAVGHFVIHHAARRVVGVRIGEGMSGVAVGMELPVGARRGELLGDREQVFRRGEGIVVPLKQENLRAD